MGTFDFNKLSEKQIFLFKKYYIDISDINKERSFEDLYMIYRVFTDACVAGIKDLIRFNDTSNVKTIKDFIQLTTSFNFYRCDVFSSYFI